MKQTSMHPFDRSSVRTGDREEKRPIASFLLVALILLAILALFVVGEFVQRLIIYRTARKAAGFSEKFCQVPPGRLAADVLERFYRELPHPLDAAALESSGLPVCEMKIAPKNLERLRWIAERVRTYGMSRGIKFDYLPAEFLLDGIWVDIDFKPRGLMPNHFRPDRPSLRLKFPRNRYLNGKRRININEPFDKGLTWDITTCRELAAHGIMTWDHRFVVLKVNGQVIGLFQEIEQFSRSMIDRHGRTEGFIFSGNGQALGDVEGFGWNKALAAMGFFVSCEDQGNVPPGEGPCTWSAMEEHLDTDKMAWATAAITLLGSWHAWYFDNIRLYFDPARGTLEPIPWDYHCFRIEPDSYPEGEAMIKVNTPGWRWGRAFLRIPEFRRMRDERLWTLITERIEPMVDHADQVFASLEGPLKHDNRYLFGSEERVWRDFFADTVRANALDLRSLYEAADLQVTAYADEDGRMVIQLENRGKAFVEVGGIIIELDGVRSTIQLLQPCLVNGVWTGVPGREQTAVSIPPGAELVGATAVNGVTGVPLVSDVIRVLTQEGSPPTLIRQRVSPEVTPLSLPANVRLEGRRLVFGPRPVHIDSTWEIPGRYSVEFMPGLNLTLESGASLIVHGDLTGKGTAGRPITVSSGRSGDLWGTLAVQGTRLRPSIVHLEHLRLHGGEGGESKRTIFTGALSITDGMVTLYDCDFTGSLADDGINLKYCTIDMRDNAFHGVRDDAVDLDFCQGAVSGSHFFDAGGDGLDLSGSEVLVERSLFERCADKGISVGERSRVEVRGTIILQCKTGVASKDESQALISETGLAGLEIGVALYNKKLTFRPPSATVEDVVLADVETAFLEAPGSRLTLSSSIRYQASDRPMIQRNGLAVEMFDEPMSDRTVRDLFLSSGLEWPATAP